MNSEEFKKEEKICKIFQIVNCQVTFYFTSDHY